MSTNELKKSGVVVLSDYRAAKEAEKAAKEQSRTKLTHSAAMNSVMAVLQAHGIDPRSLKGLSVVSRSLHDCISEHLAKGGDIVVPTNNPDIA